MWESKGNFQTVKENNDNITIQPTNDGKFNSDIVTTSNYYQITACTRVRYWARYQ